MNRLAERTFSRVMLSPWLRSNKLKIPKIFARRYYGELCSYCYLEAVRGVTHRVELEEEDDELWFGSGLEEFVDAFSVKFGYFLLFIYEGDSHFRVKIYNLTACEISYHRRHDSPGLGVSCEELDSETSVSFSSPGSDLQDEMLDSESESESESSNGSTTLTFRNLRCSHIPWLNQCRRILKPLAKARIPLPKNPFFVTSIQKYHDEKMCIPLSFARKHLRCKSGDFMRVTVDDGRQWNIQCYRHSSRCIFCHGWSGLAEDMHLETDDVCVFELTDVTNSVFRLSVLKPHPR